MKEPKTYIINMGAEGGFWGKPKEKIWDAEITLVSKEDYDSLQSENARLRKALQHIADHDEGIEFYFGDIAREALRGDITPDKGGEK